MDILWLVHNGDIVAFPSEKLFSQFPPDLPGDNYRQQNLFIAMQQVYTYYTTVSDCKPNK